MTHTGILAELLAARRAALDLRESGAEAALARLHLSPAPTVLGLLSFLIALDLDQAPP